MRVLVLLTFLLARAAGSVAKLSFGVMPEDIPSKGSFAVEIKYTFPTEQHVVVELVSEEGVHASGDATFQGTGSANVPVKWSFASTLPSATLKVYSVDRKVFETDPSHAWRSLQLEAERTINISDGGVRRKLLQRRSQIGSSVTASPTPQFDLRNLQAKGWYNPDDQKGRYLHTMWTYSFGNNLNRNGNAARVVWRALPQTILQPGLVGVRSDLTVNVTDGCLEPYVHTVQLNAGESFKSIAEMYSPDGGGGPTLQINGGGDTGVTSGQRRHGGPLRSVVPISVEELINFHNSFTYGGVVYDNGASEKLSNGQPSSVSTQTFVAIDLNNPTAQNNVPVIVPIRTCKYTTAEFTGLGLCTAALVVSMLLSGKCIGH